MTDAQRRALRTLLQAIVGALGAGLLAVVFDWDGQLVSVVTVVLTTVATAIQNALEDHGTIPSLMKTGQ